MDYSNLGGQMDAHDLTTKLWKRAEKLGVTSASAFMDLMQKDCGGPYRAVAAVGWTYTGFMMGKVEPKDVDQAWREFIENNK